MSEQNKARFTVSTPPKTKTRLDEIAERHGLSRSATVTRVLNERDNYRDELNAARNELDETRQEVDQLRGQLKSERERREQVEQELAERDQADDSGGRLSEQVVGVILAFALPLILVWQLVSYEAAALLARFGVAAVAGLAAYVGTVLLVRRLRELSADPNGAEAS